MKGDFLYHGQCELCGEETDLFMWDCLPDYLEDLDGVCCTSCGEQHEAEQERRDKIDYEQEMDLWDIK